MGFLCLFFYILLSTIAPTDIIPELAPYRLAFWIGNAGLVFSVALLSAKGFGFARLPQFGALLGFLAVLCISSALHVQLSEPIKVVSGFGISVTMFLLALWNLNSLKRLKWAAAAIVLSSLTLCVQGAYALSTGWDSWRVLNVYADESKGQIYFEDDPEYEKVFADLTKKGNEADLAQFYRMSRAAAVKGGTVSWRLRGNGNTQDPNDLAQVLVVTLPFCWLAYRKRKHLRNLICVWAPTGVLLWALYLTRSRGGVVALFAVVGLLAMRRMGKMKSGLLIGCLMVGMVGGTFTSGRAVSGGDESTDGRIDAWSEGYKMLASDPLFGVGYRQFTEHMGRQPLTAHNSYVLCFSESGLAGYFFWTTLLVASMLQLSGLLKIPGADALAEGIRRWAGALQLAMVGFITAAFFLSRSYDYVLYMLVGMVCGLTLIARREGLPLKLPPAFMVMKTALAIELATVVGIYMALRMGKLI